MTYLTKLPIAPIMTMAFALSLSASTAQAQSSEGVLGGLIGGTLGSVVSGKIDNKGSSSDGKVIGAVIGGSLGYIIGDGLDDDARLKERYNSRSGSYYRHNGKPYRRYADQQYGYVYVPITTQDRYYYSDGRRKQSAHNTNRRGQRVKASGSYRY